MKLEETLIKMKESNEENFLPLVEKMKRKASKGLLEGIKPEDIDVALSKIEEPTADNENKLSESTELLSMISETSQALLEYEKNIDSELDALTEEELESLAISYMQNEILTEAKEYDDSNEYYNFKDEEEEARKQKRKKRATIAGTVGGIVGYKTLGALGSSYKDSLINKLNADALEKGGAEAQALMNRHMQVNWTGAAKDAGITNPIKKFGSKISQKGTDLKYGVKKITDPITGKKPTVDTFLDANKGYLSYKKSPNLIERLRWIKNKVGAFKKANPFVAGGLAAAGAIAAGYGIYRLIKHIRKKRKDKEVAQNLTEEFSPALIEATQFWLSTINEDTFLELYEDEDMAALFEAAISEFDEDDEEVLDESLEWDTTKLEEEVFNTSLEDLLQEDAWQLH